jgi:RNA polymerase sigma-70 factor (ECF subfamily)
MAGPQDDGDDLVAAACRGAEGALAVLYRRTQPELVRYLRARAPGDEEDLASEVWLQVAQGLVGRELGAEGFRRLVFTVARRRLIDHGRKRSRRRTDPVDTDMLRGLPGRSDTEKSGLEALSGDEAVERIVALVADDQAEVLVLRIVAGFTVGEVAEIMGRRPAVISVLQHRALRRLARHLGPRAP